MSQPASLRQVIVVPRNGYANRLQAWASAAILAARLEAPLRVLWEPEPIAPASADDLFTASATPQQFIDPAGFVAEVGCTHQELPRYLAHRPGVISLAGHNRGEQAFMADLADLLATASMPHTLVIIAGGRYRLAGEGDFVRERREFYATIPWSTSLDARVAAAREGRGPFVGLHIRQTDRSREAPPVRAIRAGLLRMRDSLPYRSLFIAADTASGRQFWSDQAVALGFTPWCLADLEYDRLNVAAGFDALTDWRVLAATQALVHPAASTFSEEASVASGHHDRAIALHASAGRQQIRMIRDLGGAALTFPGRRLSARRSSRQSHGQPGVDG